MAEGTNNLTSYVAKVILDQGKATSWIKGRDAARVKILSYAGYDTIYSIKTTAGDWSLGAYSDNKLYWTYTPDTQYTNNENSGFTQMCLQPDGTLLVPKGFTINGTGDNHWRDGYIQINKSDGSDCFVELKRSTNADWRIVNSGGNLYFQNNWTTAKGSYFNVLQLDFNTGRAHFKEYVYASYFNASCGAETPADDSYWLFANSDGFFRKSSRINAAAKMDLEHKWVRIGGDTMTGHLIIRTATPGNNAYADGSAIQIREVNLVADTQDAWNYAPKIGFHWSNRYQGVLGLHSNGQFYFGLSGGAGNVKVHTGELESHGYLKSTLNGNTVQIGSQDNAYTHIYNSTSIPFIFNNTVETTTGNLGTNTYPWNNLYMGKANGAGIYYQGTKASYRMIRFIDNATDGNGNGISIGGGGQTIIGGGESANVLTDQAGTGGAEIMQIGNDASIEMFANLQSGYSTANYKKLTWDTTGRLTAQNWNTSQETGVSVNNPTSGYDVRMIVSSGATPDIGIYSSKHGNWLVRQTKDGYVYYLDGYNKSATRLAYSQSALAASSITYLTCWNGYELRAITKSETMVAVRSAASGSWGISITGNAATATALGTNAGSATVPIYFTGGKPHACSGVIKVQGASFSYSVGANSATTVSCDVSPGSGWKAIGLVRVSTGNNNVVPRTIQQGTVIVRNLTSSAIKGTLYVDWAFASSSIVS